MKKVAVMTDSNSGITEEEAKQYGISVVPMPFHVGDTVYYEGITITRPEFFARLDAGEDIGTSQPEPGTIIDMWNELLKENDQVVFVPMSSGLSGTCATAKMLAADYGGKVRVIDNKRISVPQLQSLFDACRLSEEGAEAEEIGRILEETGGDNSIYITVDTLKHLKKGGRITPLAAAVGTVLNIKPVLQIQGDKLDAYSKARGKQQAKEIMIDALKKDLSGKFAGVDPVNGLWLEAAHTACDEEAEEWKRELEEAFPGMECRMSPLGLSIACHTGAGAIACAFTKKMFV